MRARTLLAALALPVLSGCAVIAVGGAVVGAGVAVVETGYAVGKGAVKVAAYPFTDSDEGKALVVKGIWRKTTVGTTAPSGFTRKAVYISLMVGFRY
ncbi:MAG: hypothetical protein V4484_11820, partial [Pseudomonadota bacterium]